MKQVVSSRRFLLVSSTVGVVSFCIILQIRTVHVFLQRYGKHDIYDLLDTFDVFDQKRLLSTEKLRILRMNTTTRKIPRLLIAQYAGAMELKTNDTRSHGFYETLLQLTSTANQAYAIKWKYDFLIYRGINFLGKHHNESCFESIDKLVVNGEKLLNHVSDNTNTDRCIYNYTSSRATYNKIIVLDKVLNDIKFKGRYDKLLLLDSDAMIYDFSRDIGEAFIPNQTATNSTNKIDERIDFVVVAHKTNIADINNTGSVNIGVSIWNLDHPLISVIVKKWKRSSISRIRRMKEDDDQAPLQHMLKDIPAQYRKRVILGVSNELGYGKGKFVKHFIRPDFSTWTTRDTETKNSSTLDNERLEKVRKALREVCERNFPICSN